MPELKLWGERELSRLKHEMERLFDSLCVDYGLPGTCRRGEEMEVTETEEMVQVRICVPGMEPGDLKVDVTELGLAISGHRTLQTEGGRARTTFSRKLGLPCRVLPEHVEARLSQGVLTIDLPKCTDSRCRSIDIIKD